MDGAGVAGRSEYERLLEWARAHDLDARERAAARWMPLPEIESEWSAAPALRVGPGLGWRHCRKIIRALDAELIEIDARAELRQLQADGEALGSRRAEALEMALGALRDLRCAQRLDALWAAARVELRAGEAELRAWLGEGGSPREGWPDRFEGLEALPEGPWPSARSAAGWALDGLRADPGRSGEALSALEREALESEALASEGSRGSKGRL